jgi:hypothetical protein
MDDLFGGLIMLTVVACLVALAIAIALAMVAAAAVVGSVVVGVRGTGIFLSTLTGRVRTRGGANRRPHPPEPAFELYALGQLRRDLRASLDDAWAAMQDGRRAASNFADGCDGWMTPLGLGALLGALAGTVVGVALCGLLTLPVLLAAAVIIAGAWTVIGGLRIAEAVRRRVRKASYECPVDHERFALPVYVCPACGAEHRRLVPGRWGVLRRECQCGRVSLPTMVLNGRQRVPQQCPSGHPMAGLIGFAEIVRMALVAGPSAGKTTFLAGALLELEHLSAGGTLALAVLDDSRSDYDAALKTLSEGRLPPKTQLGANPALVAEVQGDGRSRVLSLYDVAGESYGGDDAIMQLRFLEAPGGIVLLVDPFALEHVAVDREQEIASARDRLRPSSMSPIRVLERTLGALSATGAKAERLPLAVVVVKSDALGIGDEIEQLQPEFGERAVAQWLERNGGASLVNAIDSAFGKVGWFAASALGRMPDPQDRRAFAPAGTAAPLLWLLAQKGVVPARARFSAANAADRLKAAGAQDFPPIGRLGWTLRGLPAAACVLAVFAAIGFGVAAAVRALPGVTAQGEELVSTSSADSSALAGKRVSTQRTFRRAAFTIEVPRSWRAGARDVQHQGYVNNRWHPAGDKRTTLLVDYTVGIRRPARVSARRVRNTVKRNASYRELAFGAVKLGGRTAWRWEFKLRGQHKVDYFVNACGNGYAVLGATRASRWSRYRRTFSRAARSLEPAC